MSEFRVTTERYQGWDEVEIPRRVSLAYKVIIQANQDQGGRRTPQASRTSAPTLVRL